MTCFRHSRPSGALLGLVVTIAVSLVACDGSRGGAAGGSAEPGPRYRFTRTAQSLVRLDSASGQVWLAALSGDGGWAALGAAPSPGSVKNHDGRYTINSIPGRRRPGIRQASAQILRSDRATGRTWMAEERADAEWVLIDEPGQENVAGTPVAEPPSEPPSRVSAPTDKPKRLEDYELPEVPMDKVEATPERTASNVETFTRTLNKPGLPPKMKAWAALQLGRYDPELSVPPLLEALDSEHPEVVVAAIRALRNTGDPTTIPRILELERHPDERVRAAVRENVTDLN